MPDEVLERLERAGRLDAHRTRPFDQRSDYLGWIGRARHPETRDKRIREMLDELHVGEVSMGMDHPPSRRPHPGSAAP
jgi:uncharacterized protein YdeI (YjbR/CyaY-like superfamily)